MTIEFISGQQRIGQNGPMSYAYYIEGPCLVEVERGEAVLNGGEYKTGEKILIHADRSYVVLCSEEECVRPIRCRTSPRIAENHELDLVLKWLKKCDEIVDYCRERSKCTTLILGEIECGKTTFAETLANTMIRHGLTPCLIDSDIGQSTIGFPGFISAKLIRERVLWERRPSSDLNFFVGSISPPGFEERIIRGILTLKDRYEKISQGFFIIDTDGWFGDPRSLVYKIEMINAIRPSHVVCLDNGSLACSTLINIASKTSPHSVYQILPAPLLKKERDRRTRKLLRGEKVLLSNVVVRSFDVNQVPILGPICTGILFATKMRSCESTDMTAEWTKKIEEPPQLERSIVGTVVALVDDDDRHHFGIVEKFSEKNAIIYVKTNFTGKVNYIVTSRLKYVDSTIIYER